MRALLRSSLAALGIAAAVVVLPASPAQAAWYEMGPYGTLAQCDDDRAYFNSLDDYYAQACRYQNRSGTLYDGYYFNLFYQDA
ncbi:hypothetical protein F4553_001281 [Allocatelliglobosispora scoriae]|uniref:Secreted protein n=1 Tax=Allocatelliglobosispora scoriae TaxID=643052 RepID=A0A841BMB5_9ACTN|nr:hypothetical protein [Allocatelliglobosispora scoriae]MBB5867902.1 hypothetical protein [Allocatelliglobosispora scoriae]